MLVPGPVRTRVRAQGKDRDMTGLELLGLAMLLVMLGVIFIGLPISFTLLFLALIVWLRRHGRARFQPRLPADHRPDEAGRTRRGADVHSDGIHLRSGRTDGATVQGVPRPVCAAQWRALRGRHPHRDAVRDRRRNRRRNRRPARHHGRTDDDPLGLRCAHVRRRHRRRRHARHPDPAVRDAGRDGAGARYLDHRSLCGGVRPGLPAVRDVHRLHPDPLPLQSRSSARRCRSRNGPIRCGSCCGNAWSVSCR